MNLFVLCLFSRFSNRYNIVHYIYEIDSFYYCFFKVHLQSREDYRHWTNAKLI